MKITEKSLCVELERDFLKGIVINNCIKKKSETDHEMLKLLCDVNIYNMTHKSERTLVLTSKVKKLIDKCKIDVSKDFRGDVLRTLPNRIDTIQVDENTCFKYHKTDICLYVQFFRYKPLTDQLYISDFFVSLGVNGTKEYVTSGLKVNNEDVDLFLRVITFIELTDICLKYLLPKQSLGNIMKGDYLKNFSNSKLIYVNSNWNVETIRLGTIDVSGHFRLQPYGGVNNRYYKYIFIEPYTKGLLRRLPQKELVD